MTYFIAMKSLFILWLTLFQLKSVISDCGLPAIPPNAKINDFSSKYLEESKIEYYCELPELVLLGGKVRVCKNGQWVGPIPRCAEELGPDSITRIEIIDSSGKVENNSNPINGFGGKALSNRCVAARGGSLKPVTFLIHLSKKYRHLSYFEILIQTGKETNSTDDIIEFFTNSLRTCVPKVVSPAIAPSFQLKLNVMCDLQTASDDETYYSYYNLDITTNISLKFDSSIIAICEIRLFYRKYHSFHRCGSADFPLYSSVDFIRVGSKYGIMPYYKFYCDKNFELVGNSDVRCGINNFWLDEFPGCKPKITCSIPPEKDVQSMTVKMSFYDLFVWNSSLVAIPGSKVTYLCDNIMRNSSKFVMIGDSVRVCSESGQWSGIEPYCVDIEELKLEKYSQVIEENIPNKIDLQLIIANDSTDCGLPGLPVYAKPNPGRLVTSGDFRSSYINGSKISYQCESVFHYMYSRFDTRVCINGKWVGKIGKCELNYGGSLALKSIEISDYSTSEKITEWIRPKRNTSGTDDWFGYNAFNGWQYNECAPMNLTQKQKWTLRLNDTQPISGFFITLRPGGIYRDQMTPKKITNITSKAFMAKVGRTFCEIGFAYDYVKYHTTINYLCEHDSALDYSSYSIGVNEIVLYVDPKQFLPKYDVNNFTFCSLTIYRSTDNCGIPDKPLHSIVKVENQVAKYSCEDGYQLIGKDSVSCLRNGKWSDDFPICKLKTGYCTNDQNNKESGLKFNYQNTIANGSIIIGTVVEYSCLNISSFGGRSILVGSRTRICLSNGQWSGSNPFCIDSSKYMSTSDSSKSSANNAIIILICVVIISVIIGIISGIVVLFRRGVIPNVFNKSRGLGSSASLPIRPDSKVDICDINATLEQLSCFESNVSPSDASNNNRLRVDRNKMHAN